MVWELFRDYIVARDLIAAPGPRLDELVQELQRAAARARALPRTALQCGLRGRADLVLQALAADRVGRDGEVNRFIEAVPDARSLCRGSADRRL